SSLSSDDVDHAVYRVRTPDGGAGAADDFDAVDVLKQSILDFPIRAGEERIVDVAAVDDHEHRAAEPASEASNANGIFHRVDSRDLHSRYRTEYLGDIARARPADVLSGDYINASGGTRNGDGLFRSADNFNVAELPQTQVL